MDTYKKTSNGWKLDSDGFNLLSNNSKYLTKKFNIEEVKKEEVNEDGWSEVSTLPYSFDGSSDAVVLNNEIHILDINKKIINHYKYNTSTNTWSSVSSCSFGMNTQQVKSIFAVVYNNEIHIMGQSQTQYGNSDYYHYKYNNGTWSSVSTFRYKFYDGSDAVVLNNEIHLFGGNTNNHYKYNGSTWSNISTLPYEFRFGSAIVYNNEIHIMGGNYNTNTKKYHYKYNTSTNTWSSVSTLPYDFYEGSAVVYNNEIHMLSHYYYHFKYNSDTNTWTSVKSTPYQFYDGSAVVLNNEIHILGGSESYYKHYKYYSNQYLKEVTPFKSRYIKTANGWKSIDTVEETYNKINEKIKELPMKIVKID